MDYSFISIIGLEILIFGIVGSPLCFYLSKEFEDLKVIAILTAAPIFGVIELLFFGTLGLKLHLSQYLVTSIVIFFSLMSLCYIILKYWKNNYTKLIYYISLSLAIIFIITSASIVLYTSDIQNIGSKNYFLLTNEDTFSYIAEIDQIRFVGALSPQYEYPAGYYALFSHAVNIRAAVTAFVASQSDIFSLETHVAFFILLRCVIPLMAIGIFSILVLSNIEIKYCIFGTALFLGGNFCVNQIFQQFLSSAFGDVCSIGLIILIILALHAHKKSLLVFLCGLVTGILAAASPETHPFYLIILLVFSISLILILFKTIILFDAFKKGFYYFLGFLCGIVALFPGLFIDLWVRSGALGGHPGDWIAQVGFFLQTFGILPGFGGDPLISYGITNILLMIIIFGFVVISPVYVIIKLIELKKTNAPQLTTQIFLGVLSSVFILSFLSLFIMGRGYAMQKVSEYFCFVPAIICSIILNDVEVVVKRNKIALIIFFIATIIFLLVFLSSTLPLKQEALNHTYYIVKENPDLDSYSITPLLNNSIKSVDVDIQGPALNLFLYQNRMTELPISFTATDTIRFYRIYNVTPADGEWVFHMSHPNTLQSKFWDITQPPTASNVIEAQLVKRSNYVKIFTAQSNWIPMEGKDSSDGMRWLSNNGSFVIMSCDPNSVLHIYIGGGPDLTPDNKIQIIINSEIVSNLTPYELPKELNLKISNVKIKSDVNGEIKIIGPQSGIRQIRVARLYIKNSSEFMS